MFLSIFRFLLWHFMFKITFIHYLFCVCGGGRITCGRAIVTRSEDNGQSQFSPPTFGSRGSSSGCQAEWHTPVPPCMTMRHAYAWYPRRPEEGIRYSETGRDGYGSPCRFWESNPAPLVEQSPRWISMWVLHTCAASPLCIPSSFQPCVYTLIAFNSGAIFWFPFSGSLIQAPPPFCSILSGMVCLLELMSLNWHIAIPPMSSYWVSPLASFILSLDKWTMVCIYPYSMR